MNERPSGGRERVSIDRIGPLELQIAYKLYLSAQKDFEDAVHFYTLFEETLSSRELERWVERLGVEDEYERLRRA